MLHALKAKSWNTEAKDKIWKEKKINLSGSLKCCQEEGNVPVQCWSFKLGSHSSSRYGDICLPICPCCWTPVPSLPGASHFSSPILLCVPCLLILNRQITLFPCALKVFIPHTRSGLCELATLSYPANVQGGIQWGWWAQSRRLAPNGASHRHAAAGTEVLSGGRREGGSKLIFLGSSQLVPPEQRSSKVFDRISPTGKCTPCLWLSFVLTLELKHQGHILAPDVLLNY